MRQFNLPDLGEGLEEAEIVAWHVNQGDHVVTDQPLVSGGDRQGRGRGALARTKLVDQQGFGGPAKGGSNDIMDRRSIMQLFFTNDHRGIVRRERVSNTNGCNGSSRDSPTA